MLYISKCHHQYEKGHLATDVTFTLADAGITQIYDSQNSLQSIFNGIYEEHTTIKVDDEQIDLASEEGFSKWRTQYFVAFHEVNEILYDKTILENITLFYQDRKEDVDKAIQMFELQNHIHDACEEASFDVIAKMLCSRIYLRGQSILLLEPHKIDYTKEEYELLASSLLKLANEMQVIVLGDISFKLPAHREITIYDGHIMADSGYEEVNMMTHRQGKPLPLKTFTYLMKRMHHRYSFLYHVLLLFLMISFFVVSVLLSGNTLHIEDIQLSMLKRDHKSSFEIKRYVSDAQGNYYSIDDVIKEEDLKELPLREDDLICSYRPINTYYANAYLEGVYEVDEASIYNQYDICELHDVSQLEASQIVGSFPDTFGEVIMSYQLASTFFDYSPQGMIGQKLRWYGLNITISGVFLDKNAQNDTNFYALKGFMEHHPLSLMNIFSYSIKHLYTSDMHVELYDYQELNPTSLFYNGKKNAYASTLKENEVVLDIATAIELGFPYDEIAGNMYMSYEKKLEAYYDFVKQFIGKEISVKAETLPTTSIDTSIYQEQKIIAGTLIPNMNTMHKIASIKPKVLYFKKGTLTSYLGKNYYLTSLQYQSRFDVRIKQALSYLEADNPYYADLNNTLLLKVLITDIKDLSSFFVWMFIGFGFMTLWLYYVLMRKTLFHNRKELQLIYAFGYPKTKIRLAFKERFLNKMKHYFYLSLGMSLLLLFIYYFIIFVKLSRNITIFIYLIIPLLIYVIYGGLFMVITKIYLYQLFRSDEK